MNIVTIEFVLCKTLWKELWANRIVAADACSYMVLPNQDMRYSDDCFVTYSDDVDPPVYLGAFENGKLIGVNSFHRIAGTTRSRGLYVVPEYRDQGIGRKLLYGTWDRARVYPIWAYPKKDALPVFLAAGYKIASIPIKDPIEGNENYYVIR